jgi:Na+-transporting NADH:ubiquinone oxidoreductase subunit NqrD
VRKPTSSRPGGGKRFFENQVFENQQISYQIAAIKSLLAVNQRVKLAIKSSGKNERDSEVK